MSPSRSCSPHRSSWRPARSRSPTSSSRHTNHHSHHKRRRHDVSASLVLPFGARSLSKRDLMVYEPVLALYLDIQKNILLEDLSTEETKGRWKSFVGKWNRGDLAEGWYDPKTLQKALNRDPRDPHPVSDGPKKRKSSAGVAKRSPSPLSSDSSEYGPNIPLPSSHNAHGPTVPTMQDLLVQRENTHDTSIATQEASRTRTQNERRLERHRQAEALDELVPRAVPGTRERQLEKKRERTASNRAFAAESRGRSPDVADEDAMGGGDGVVELKRLREKEERRKNEREIRREEGLRARAAEREERMRGLREREERTMESLRDLARRNFGDPPRETEGGA